jgi:flavin reductase (DIM6/NTAB) family NADH-FMN oxidoreductase RutF
MKIKIEPQMYYKLINHGPCCLITSGNGNIKNVAPIAWITPLNDEPPLVIICVASTHYTAELINKYKEFVINIPSVNLIEEVKLAGKISGRKKDKFEMLKLTVEEGVKIDVVHIKECIGFIEAKLVDKKEYEGVTLFIGKVVYCEVEKDVFDGENLIPEKAKTIHHVSGNKFFISSKVI